MAKEPKRPTLEGKGKLAKEIAPALAMFSAMLPAQVRLSSREQPRPPAFVPKAKAKEGKRR